MVLNCISLISDEVKHRSMCWLVGHLRICFGEMSIPVLLLFLSWVICLFYCYVVSVLYIFCILDLYKIYDLLIVAVYLSWLGEEKNLPQTNVVFDIYG